jgi:hypothetical protein
MGARRRLNAWRTEPLACAWAVSGAIAHDEAIQTLCNPDEWARRGTMRVDRSRVMVGRSSLGVASGWLPPSEGTRSV